MGRLLIYAAVGAAPACALSWRIVHRVDPLIFLLVLGGLCLYTLGAYFILSKATGRAPLSWAMPLPHLAFLAFFPAVGDGHLLVEYLDGIVLFSWLCAQLAYLTWECRASAWISGYLGLMASLPILTLPKFPWKYPFDFEGYALNLLFFPLAWLGLSRFMLLFFGFKTWLATACPLLLIFIFPMRAFFKIFWGILPPSGLASAAVLLGLSALGVFMGVKGGAIIKEREKVR